MQPFSQRKRLESRPNYINTDTDMNATKLFICCAALLLHSNVAWSQDDTGDADATIRLMGAAEAELPEAVTKEITLPAAVDEDSEAVEKAAQRLETANENRERRETGLTQADEARERGAEMAAEAQNNRESRGRSEDRPEPPVNPGQPDN